MLIHKLKDINTHLYTFCVRDQWFQKKLEFKKQQVIQQSLEKDY